jgi:hypothetical protein
MIKVQVIFSNLLSGVSEITFSQPELAKRNKALCREYGFSTHGDGDPPLLC